MTSSDAFAEKMAKMMQALDSVDISKDGGARLGGGGPLYFNQDDRAGEERKPDVGPEMEESKDEEVELYGDTMDDEDAEYVTEWRNRRECGCCPRLSVLLRDGLLRRSETRQIRDAVPCRECCELPCGQASRSPLCKEQVGCQGTNLLRQC
ncbi:hypothetical protein Ae201684P_012104 [Aphanomyces euteiches]|nr:hypothetical protein Ae201684P_012104 [Aphanomyces euteiches]